MKKRALQREETRERIVDAAAEAFSELGFSGASTRVIAARADANQGLITYHFRSKEDLWRAAADQIFGAVRAHFHGRLDAFESMEPRERAREAIREFVRFAAAHPELFRFMVDEGKTASERLDWLIETHLRPMYEDFLRLGAAFGDLPESQIPHAFYVMTGAGSIIFAVAPECRRLTGLDPETEAAVEAHAEFVARLLVP